MALKDDQPKATQDQAAASQRKAEEAAEAAHAAAEEAASPPAEAAAEQAATAAEHAADLARADAKTLRSSARMRLCPHCHTEMTPHSAADPEKAGAWHCNQCGGCWAPGQPPRLRAGHPAPVGWKDN